MRFSVECFQFFIQLFQFFFEVEIVRCSFSDSNVTSWIQTPSLCFYVRERCGLAEPSYVRILPVRELFAEHSLTFRACFYPFSSVEPDNICKKLDLRWREIPMRPINLPENMPCINKKYFSLALGLHFPTIQEPKRAG